MLRCILSRIAHLQLDNTVTRLCSSQSFKDRWPRKIREIELRNPVRLKRRPQLFASSDYKRHGRRSHFDEGAEDRRNRYIQRSRDDYDDREPYYPRDDEGAEDRRSRYIQRSRDDYDDRGTHYPREIYEKRYERTARTYESDISEHDNDYDYGRRHVQHAKSSSLASQMLDDLNTSGVSNDGDPLFGGYSKESKERLRELIGADKEREYAAETEDNFIRLSHENRGPNSLHTYESKIERFCKQGRLEEAEQYFDKLVNEYRFKPTAYMYSNLVKAYAKQGNLKRCFSLYNQMKKRGLEPRTSHIYTSLFEVCLMFTSDKQQALQEATHLLGRIRHRNVEMSAISYNAAVKCFGLLGDVETAFRLADECPSNPSNDSYMLSSLLIACNSHSHAGFQLAVSVWRSMRKKKHLLLTTKQYNLLLRTLYNGSGDMNKFRQLIQHQQPREVEQPDQSPLLIASAAESVESSAAATGEEEEQPDQSPLLIASAAESVESSAAATGEEVEAVFSGAQLANREESVQLAVADTIPDILNFKLKLPVDMTVKGLNTANDRLIALGGVCGVLQRMKSHSCKPDIVTFFYLLRALPNNRQCEEKLLQIMEEHEVAADADFYQYVFIRMLRRKCSSEVFNLYLKTREDKIEYKKSTYTILCEVCTTLYKCQQVLNDMREQDIQPDLHILKVMLLQAGCTHFEHLELILEEMDRCSIKPDREVFSILRHKFDTGKSRLVTQEKNPQDKPRIVIDGAAMQKYSIFYSAWLETKREELFVTDNDHCTQRIADN